MNQAQEIATKPSKQPETKLPETVVTNPRWAGYAQLLIARMKELWREPEVIFWVFIFPLLLAFGLGIAFRGKPRRRDAGGCRRRSAVAADCRAAEARARARALHVDVVDAATALDRFRLGTYALVIVPQRWRGAVPLRSGASGERAGPHASG